MPAADRRERIAQLVRQQRDELVLAAVGFAELQLRLLAAGDVDERHRDAVGPCGSERYGNMRSRYDLPFSASTSRSTGQGAQDALRVGDEIVVAQR